MKSLVDETLELELQLFFELLIIPISESFNAIFAEPLVAIRKHVVCRFEFLGLVTINWEHLKIVVYCNSIAQEISWSKSHNGSSFG